MSRPVDTFNGAFPEVMQELERLKAPPAPQKSVRIRLRRDDLKTQRLLAVFHDVCQEEVSPFGVVSRRLVKPYGEARLFAALREAGVPIDSLVPSAPQPVAQATAAMSGLLNMLGSVLPAARPGFDEIEERL